MRSFVSTFRNNLKAAGASDDDEMVWKILRRFHILVFDFTAPDSASVDLMHERALRALDPGSIDEARNLWSRLTELALQIAATAGHRTRDSLIADLTSFRLAPRRNNRRALASTLESLAYDEVAGRGRRVREARGLVGLGDRGKPAGDGAQRQSGSAVRNVEGNSLGCRGKRG
jgi:hypothetical protein